MAEYHLPSYAFVPGRSPHPTRHADGHSYGTLEHTVQDPRPTTWPDDPLWRHAFRLFDAGFYWEAHEAWEAFWLLATDDDKAVIGSLIGAAAAGVKIRQGKIDVALRLLRRSESRLEPLAPPVILALDIHGLRRWFSTETNRVAQPVQPKEDGAQTVFSTGLGTHAIEPESRSS